MGPNNRSEQRCGLYPRNGVQLTAKNAKNTEGEELGWVPANPREWNLWWNCPHSETVFQVRVNSRAPS